MDGIDVQHTKTVLFFDLPQSEDSFLKASGRCGRYGRSGYVLTLLNNDDKLSYQTFQKNLKLNAEELPSNYHELFKKS